MSLLWLQSFHHFHHMEVISAVLPWSRRPGMVYLLPVPGIPFLTTFPFVHSASSTLVFLLFLTCQEHFHLWPCACCFFFLTHMSFPEKLHVSHTHFIQFSPCMFPSWKGPSWPAHHGSGASCLSPASCIGLTSWHPSIHLIRKWALRGQGLCLMHHHTCSI